MKHKLTYRPPQTYQNLNRKKPNTNEINKNTDTPQYEQREKPVKHELTYRPPQTYQNLNRKKKQY